MGKRDVILGRTVDGRRHHPLSDLRVEAWVADGAFGRSLAAATTDRDGLFRMELSTTTKRYVYFKVFQADRLVASTEGQIGWTRGVGQRHIEIDVPLGGMPSALVVLVTASWDDDGSPAAGVAVEIVGAPSRHGQTDGRGVLRLPMPGEKPAQAQLLVTFPRAAERRSFPVALAAAGGRVDIGIPASARPGAKPSRRLVRIGPYQADARALEDYGPEIVLDIARVQRHDDGDGRLRAKIARVCPDLFPARRRELCGRAVEEAVKDIMRLQGWIRETALDHEVILYGGRPGFIDIVYDGCPNFRFTYNLDGPDAVPASTAAEEVIEPGGTAVLALLLDGDPPTYIKRLCFWLERALAAYISPPFSMLNPAAAGKIPVRVQRYDKLGTGSSFGMIIESRLTPDLMCAVAVHELFHVVQDQYPFAGTSDWYWSFTEGGAVFAEDSAADRMNRYLDEAGTNGGPGVLASPQSSLADYTFRYKASLFFRYIAEQHSPRITPGDEPAIGVETYRALLERATAGSYTNTDLRDGLRDLPWYQDFYEFAYLDAARQDRTASETTLGNFYLACYLKDLGTDVPDRRFDFMEDEDNIFFDEAYNAGAAALGLDPEAADTTLTSVDRTLHTLGAAPITIANSLAPMSARFHEIAIDPAVTSVRVDFTADTAFTSLILHLVLIDEDDQIRDIVRTDKASFTKQVANLRDGKRLSKAVLVPVGASVGGSYTLSVISAGSACDVMVTRWHSLPGTEYEIDSRNWAWTWVSPDIWVDNGGDGAPDPEVYFDFDNQLFIRLRNKGNAAAAGIGVQFWYQDASGGLTDAGWTPVLDQAGSPQSLGGLTLDVGEVNSWSVAWSPTAVGSSKHYCIRAVVSVPGDPNVDNKRVLSNFGNVIVQPTGFTDLHLIRYDASNPSKAARLEVIPRLGADLHLSDLDVARLAAPPVDMRRQATEPLRIRRYETAVAAGADRPAKDDGGPCRHRPPRLQRRPDPRGHYAADPRTLPPGYAGRPMITVARIENGLAVGGVSYLVSRSGRKR
jgi:hypothetical protein